MWACFDIVAGVGGRSLACSVHIIISVWSRQKKLTSPKTRLWKTKIKSSHCRCKMFTYSATSWYILPLKIYKSSTNKPPEISFQVWHSLRPGCVNTSVGHCSLGHRSYAPASMRTGTSSTVIVGNLRTSPKLFPSVYTYCMVTVRAYTLNGVKTECNLLEQ